MRKNVLILPGDGIGPEIVAQAERVLQLLIKKHGLEISITHGLIGGSAIDKTGVPLPEATLMLAKKADAILLGAVGGPRWDNVDRSLRPERGLLTIRSALNLYANLRPAFLYEELADASPLKIQITNAIDIMIVRELIGGIYFGQPRGIVVLENGQRQGFNTMVYSESEIIRIAHTAFNIAMHRNKKVCSVDKANVLEVSQLWREIINHVSQDYPQVNLQHMYVDNAAMQLVMAPGQFDVIVTNNMFGDILSDLSAMLTGSIGMLPSASLDSSGKGMYEPIHGSAPDIAGRDIANPLATIMSVAMMLRYSLNELVYADRLENAVKQTLAAGYRTADIYSGSGNTEKVSTSKMGNIIYSLL